MEQRMDIHWYPGHMAKARRLLQEDLRVIDVVAELVDARAPRATSNPDFNDLFAAKSRMVVLNKADLADPALTKEWEAWYRERGVTALPFISTGGNRKLAIQRIEQAAAEKVARMRAKGVNKTVRVLVAGIPNVGKSTFINRIAGGARTKVGDRPGVTKGKQWVRITPLLEMLDTPGLLWPKLDQAQYAQRLAFLGAIKDDIMDVHALATLLLQTLQQRSPARLTERYMQVLPDTPGVELLTAVATSRNFLLRDGELDTERAARIVLDEFRAGRIGRITLDLPGEELTTLRKDSR